MTKQTFVPMTTDNLKKEIIQIGKVGAKLNIRIQIAAQNAIHYSIVHGYIEYANLLLLSMNNGQRKNSLVAFMEKHGKLAYSKENKGFVFKKRDDVTVESCANINEHWQDAIKVPELKSTYDFDDEASRFIKKMEKAIQQDNATIKAAGVYDYMVAAFNQFHADQIAIEEMADEDESNTVDDVTEEIAELLAAERNPIQLAA